MVLVDVEYGLIIGVGISLVTILLKDQFVQIRYLSEYFDGSTFVDKDLVLVDPAKYVIH